MRILTVSNLYPPNVIGGYELGCRQMVEALRARGHEVQVLTSRARAAARHSAGIAPALALTDWHLRPHRPEVPAEVRRVMDIRAHLVDSANVAALVDALDEFEPDAVYLWNVSAVGGFGIAGALAYIQVPVVWHLMDAVPKSAVTVGGHIVGSAARLLSHRLRARYLACSQRLCDEIAAAGFNFSDRVDIVPNWVEPMPPDRERAFYPSTGTRLRIVAAGQLAPHKGIDVMLDAASQLLDHGHSGFSIDIFGTGLDDHYHTLISGRGLSDRVRLHGGIAQSELVDRFWDYDVFLFPTWDREPFAFAPMEAAARGCVPMISENCGNSEWFVDGVHCIKVARRANAVAAAVAAVLDHRTTLAPIARRARRAIATSFTIDRAVDAVERALQKAVEVAAARPGRIADTYDLARLAETLSLDWAEQPGHPL
jgi:glycogen synthase